MDIKLYKSKWIFSHLLISYYTVNTLVVMFAFWLTAQIARREDREKDGRAGGQDDFARQQSKNNI